MLLEFGILFGISVWFSIDSKTNYNFIKLLISFIILKSPKQIRNDKHSLRQTNGELMDRLKKLWNCYKEKSPEWTGSNSTINTINISSATTTSANNFYNDYKVVIFCD